MTILLLLGGAGEGAVAVSVDRVSLHAMATSTLFHAEGAQGERTSTVLAYYMTDESGNYFTDESGNRFIVYDSVNVPLLHASRTETTFHA